MSCQHGAGEEQVAADAALSAFSLTGKQLGLDIPLSAMNQPETPELTGGVQ
jgi:hypothetical protein